MKHSLKLLVRIAIRLLAALLPMGAVLAQAFTGGEVAVVERNSAGLAVAIQSAAEGDIIRLPEGTIEINDPIALKSGVKLIGAGQDKTRIVYRGTKTTALMRIDGCQDVEVAEMTLDGEDNPLVRDGITGTDSRRLNIHNLTIRNLGKDCTSFSHGIIFSGHNPTMKRGVTDSVIADCRFEKIGLKAQYGGAIRLAWGSARNRAERNVVVGTGRGGIFGDHSSDLVIRENHVSGSGGEGLGIEIWGGCPRSLIEDNVVDHWISMDADGQGQSAVRRNIVGAEDGSLKYIGIEIIANNVVVTDNQVKRGQMIGLSASNKSIKNNAYWGYNTVSDCIQWGAQLQGDTGVIAHHYFYKCIFGQTPRGNAYAIYPNDSGHGFRLNGNSQGMTFEECVFVGNGGFGLQIGGRNVDALSFINCAFEENCLGSVIGLSPGMVAQFKGCQFSGKKASEPVSAKTFPTAAPTADFRAPQKIHVGSAARFECASKAVDGDIVERLWDFNHGIPKMSAKPEHTFEKPGIYRVTLIVWDSSGRGARAEKRIEVTP